MQAAEKAERIISSVEELYSPEKLVMLEAKIYEKTGELLALDKIVDDMIDARIIEDYSPFYSSEKFTALVIITSKGIRIVIDIDSYRVVDIDSIHRSSCDE